MHTSKTGHLPVWEVIFTDEHGPGTEQVCAANSVHAIQQLAGFMCLPVEGLGDDVRARRIG